MDQGFVTCWRISGIRLDHDLGGCLFILAKKEYEMKVVKKLLAPVLVVGLLLTSLVSLHHLKDNKKSNVLRIGISQYITHKSLDATRKGFIAELKKAGYVDGKNIQIDFQNAQG